MLKITKSLSEFEQPLVDFDKLLEYILEEFLEMRKKNKKNL